MDSSRPTRVFEFYRLEDRVLLSADGAEAIDAPADADAEVLDQLLATLDAEGQAIEERQEAAADVDGEAPSQADEPATSRQIVFVDAGVEDVDELLAGITDQDDTDWLIIQLESDQDGIDQITQTLATLEDVDAVHILSHGDGLGIQLGSARLDLNTAEGYAGDIASWADALDADADLLIYGCDLAGTEDGRALIDALSLLCECDVAASDDATGHESLGGDWDLEYQVGSVTSELAVGAAAQSSWFHTLDISTGLVGHFEFETGSGTTAVDSSGNQDGTLINSPSWNGNGAVGDDALDFTGDAVDSNSFVQVPDYAGMDISGNFSVAFWYNTNVTQGDDSWLVGSHDGGQGFYIYASSDGSLNFFLEGDDGSTTRTVAGGLIADGQWHQVTATRTGDNIRLYVDALSSGTSNEEFESVNVNAPLVIGAEGATGPEYEGLIDDVRIYTRSLSASDIDELVALRDIGQPDGYPAAWGDDNSQEWITNVNFAGIDNTTGQEVGGYGNYSNQSGTVDHFQTNTLSVSIDDDGDNYITAWVDWNQDGDFTDAGEEYVVASGVSSSGPFTVDITTPGGALTGDTIMRVGISNGSAPTSVGSHSEGEFEDYTITVTTPLPGNERFFFTTNNDVSNAGTPGIDTWQNAELLEFGNNPSFEPTGTSGTLSSVFNLNDYSSNDAGLNAAHVVSRDVTVGNINLQRGDLVFSTIANETISGISTNDEDILVFRPTVVGDFSSGTIFQLLDGSDIGISGDVQALTIAETSMNIGGTNVNAGDLIVANDEEDLTLIQLTTAGASSSGSTSLFLDASDLGVNTANRTVGLHLASETLELGAETVTTGTFLMTLTDTDSFAGLTNVEAYDVVSLSLTATGATSAGTATTFFDGSDINLNVSTEEVHSIAVFNIDYTNTIEVDTDADYNSSHANYGDTSSLSALLDNRGADGLISLREAIDAANNQGGTDTITFNIAGGGTRTISLTEALSDITDSVILDATTQSGYVSAPVIEVDGSALVSGSAILNVIASDSTIRGFSLYGSPDEGIEIDGSTGYGDNNTIEGNWVGIDASGTVRGNAQHGILITAGADGNQIGGTGANQGNVIAGTNATFGAITITANSDGNTLEGNIIGFLADGVTAAANAGNGILISLSSDNNVIGGTTAGARNIIGNSNDGINLDGTTDATYTTVVTGTIIQGNYIGVDATGATAAGNADEGISISNGVTNTLIGGSTSAARNIISGNGGAAILIQSGSSDTTIQNNYVGTDITGTLDLGNGKPASPGNEGGIRFWNAGTGNLVGGTDANEGNLIIFNDGDGIDVGGTTDDLSVLGNLIYSNTGLGIDLNSDDVTSNDADDSDSGPNNLQNFPVLNQADLSGSNLTVSGTIDTDGANTQYRIEFFATPSGTQDATHGEAQYYLGTTTVTTDGSGDGAFNTIVLSGVTLGAGDFVTATATRISNPAQVGVDDALAYGSTSEFAANRITAVAPTQTIPIAQTTDEDTDLVFSTAGGNAITVSDGTADDTRVQVSLSVTNGTLTLNNFGGYVIVEGANGSASMTLEGTESAINAGLEDLTYTPTADYNGSDNLVVTTALNADLEGLYTFEAGNADDQSAGTAENGTLNGDATTIIDGTRGEVLSLDGAGDYVQFTSRFGEPTDVTLAAWINLDAGAGQADVINIGNNLLLRVEEGSNGFALHYYQGSSSWGIVGDAAIDLDGDGWHHVAATFDDTGDRITVYLDGREVASLTTTDSIDWTDDGNTNTFTAIGSRSGGSGYNLDGLVDDARIYSRALSANEIASIASDQALVSGTVPITIDPVNDSPTIAVNTGATVDEGSSGNAITTAMLDEGDPDDDGAGLTYTVTSVTTNGTLRNNGTALGLNDTFTQADIDGGLITYDHDGSETTSDSFDFSLADGGEDGATPATGTFNFTIDPVNESPTITTNTGITVNEGDTGSTITTAMLNEGDPDDDGAELTYTVTGVTSNGTLRNNGTALGLNDTFTQADIDAGLITYDHDGSETTSDSFGFSLADGGENGATPVAGTFNIAVTLVNESPTVATNTGATVDEGSSGNTVTTAMLNEGDPDDNGNELTYTVTSVTSNGTLRNNGTALGLNDTFTQADIDAGLITYDHDGSETTSDSFNFSLADGGEDGATPATGTFNFTVDPVNESPTIATNTGATVDEGSAGNTVTTAMLNEGDPDDDGAGLTYTVTSVTANGTLRNNGTALGLNDTFTQADIDGGLLTYDHDGSETTADSFDFSLADGGENGAAATNGTFNFTINPVNDASTIAVNTGTLVNEGDIGSVITNAMLNEGDVDDDGAELTYTVTGVTANGTLRNNGTALGLNDTFTQADIDAGLITYDHNGGETTSDSFDFSLADGGEDGAVAATGTFNISVLQVNDDPTNTGSLPNDVTVSEDVASSIDLSSIDLNDPDVGGGNLTLTLVTATGGDLSASSGGGVTVTGSGTGRMTLTGTQADLNTFLDNTSSISYLHGTAHASGNDLDTITVFINDNGNTGSGGGNDINLGTVNVDVTASNDAPIAQDDSVDITENDTVDSQDDWFDADWQFRRTLSFNNLAGTENLADFPVLIELDSSRIDYSETQNQGQDLRFVDGDGNVLAHEIETWNESGTSFVWVRVPQIDMASATDFITMYYGNALAPDAQGNVWTSNYQGVFHMDDAGPIEDSSANGFDATNNGSVDAAAQVSDGQSFDGSTQWIDLGTNRDWLNGTTAATLSAWINTDSTSNAGDIVSVSVNGASPQASRAAIIQSGDEIQVIARADDTNSGDQVTVTTTSSPLSEGTWHHVAAVIDYANDSVDIYVNGELQTISGSTTFINTSTPNTSSDYGAIGANEQAAGGLFDGLIDEVRIADTARSAEWIEAQYAATTGTFVMYGAEQQAAGVLGNDIDFDGDALTVTAVNGSGANVGSAITLASGALLTVNADGSYTYDTNGQFDYLDSGQTTTDSFTYTTSDGTLNDNGIVTFNITGVNDSPLTATNTGATVDEGSSGNTVTTAMLGEGDLDDDGAELTYTVTGVTSNGTLRNNGTALGLNDTFTQADIDAGLITYDHDGSETTSDSFDFSLADGGEDGATPATGTFNFTINPVNEAPTIATNTGIGVTEGDTGSVITTAMLNEGDPDDDGLELTYTVTTVTANGTLRNNGTALGLNDTFTQADIDAGLITYDHDGSETTSDSFDFSLADGGEDSVTPATGTFNITIASSNDAPVASSIEGTAISYTENDGAVTITSSLTLTDADDTQLESAVVQISANYVFAEDVLTFTDQNGISGIWDAVTRTLALSGTSSVANYETAIRSITYTNTSDNPSELSRTVSITVNDGDTNSAAVTRDIDITATNDQPVAHDDSGDYVANLTASSPIGHWRLGESSGPTAVDETGTSDGTYNGVTLGATGAIAGDADSAATFNGSTDYIEIAHDPAYLVDDGTVQLWFNASSPGTYQGLFSKDASGNGTGGHFSIGIDASGGVEVRIQDTSSSYFVRSSAGSVSAGTWHHVAVSFGTEGLQLFLDGQLVDSDTYQGGLGTSSGGSGNADPIVLGASAQTSGDLSATPLDDFFTGSIDEVAIFGSQLSQDDIQTLYHAGRRDYALTEDATLNVSVADGVLADDFDVDGDSLVVSAVEGVGASVGNQITLGSGALLTLYSDGRFDYDTNGQFDSLDSGQQTTDTFTYTVDDGNGQSDTATVTVVITGTNDSASVSVNTGATVDEGSSGNTVTTAMLNEGDPDDDGNELTYTVTSVTSNGTLRNNGTALGLNDTFTQADIDAGLITYDHDGSETTSDSFDFSLADGGEDGATAATGTFNFTVDPVNESPTIATNTGISINEGDTGSTITAAMLNEGDPDDDGNELTYTVTSVTSNGTLRNNGTALGLNDTFTQTDIDAGLITYDHDGTETTSDSFDFSLADGGEDGATPVASTFNIAVTLVNESPTIATNTGATVDEGSSGNTVTTAMLNEGDPDDDGNELTYTVSSVPSNGTLRNNGTALGLNDTFTQADIDAGLITYDHDGSETTSDSFDFSLADGGEDGATPATGTFNFTVDPVNESPTIATNTGISVNEGDTGSTITTAMLNEGDPDDDGNELTYTVTSITSNGTLRNNGTALGLNDTFTQADIDAGLITYDHNGTETTSDSFDFSLADGGEDGATPVTGTFNIAVTLVNESPTIATNTGATVDEGSSGNTVTTAMLNEGDPDDDGNELTYTVTSVTSNGTLRNNGTALGLNDTFTQADIDAGLITYDHDGSETTSDSFDFSLADGGEDGATPATGTFNFTVDPVNESPTIATNTGITVNEGDTGSTITTAMLNEGDPDDDGNELTYTVTSVTSNGTLRNNGTALGLNDTFTQADIDAGLITYDHDGTETTSDSFDFSLADGGEDGATPVAGTFNIGVTLVNESPTIATNTGATVDESSSGNTVTTAMLNEGDPDDDGAELTYTVTSVTSNGTLRNNGTALGLNDTFTQADIDAGLITYDHDGSETTSDSFDFSLADGGEDGATPATGTFNFTVDLINESPTVATNTGISVNEGDTGSTITTAMLNEGDPDDDGNELTYTVTSVTSNGTLRNNGTALGLNDTFTQADIDAGLITYDHDGTETTSDSFDFSLADGGEDGATPIAGTFNITVTLVNESPTIAVNTGATVDEGSSGNTVTTAMLDEGDPDDDGNELTYTVTSVTSNGTLRNNGTALGLNDTFTQADIDAGLITYDHGGSETTSDSFNFSLADGGEDGATPATGTFNFTVDPVNESPTIATNTGISVNEGDTGSTITTAMLNEGDPDDDGNELTYTVTSVTSNGTLRNNGTALGLNDTFTQADIDAGLITYDHNGTETTSDSFDFSLADGGEDGATPVAGTFNIAVTLVNESPTIATNTGATVDEGSSGNTVTTAMLNEGDPDDDGAELTYTVTSVTSNGTLRNNGTALGLHDTFTQADIDAGLITYDHDGSETTSDSFDFSLADGGEDGATPATGTFNFTVDPVNESPTIATNTGISVNEGDTGSTITTAMLNEGDPDDDGNELTYTVTSVTSNGTLRNNGTALGLNDTFTQADIDAGLITYDHDGTETTSDSFDFSLADGGEDGATPVAGNFNITVTLVNESPTIAVNTGATVDEGSSGNTVTTAMLNEGDPDDDGAELTYTVTSVTSNGTLRNNGTALGLNDTFTQADIDAGLITYDHDGSETTSDSFDFSLADGGEDGAMPATGTFNLTVDPINESPTIATNTGITVNEGDTGSTITTAMLNEGDPDDDGNELTYTVTSVTNNGTLRNNGTALGLNDTFTQADIDAGLITYDHVGTETTSDSFDFSLADGGEDGATPVAGTFNISVTLVNESPTIATNTGATVDEGSSGNTVTTAMLNEGDPDDDGNELSYTVTSVTSNGTLRNNGTALGLSDTFTQADIDAGLITYDHDGSETTSDSFDFSLADGGEDGATPATGTFNFTVDPVNESPTIAINTGITVNEGDTGSTITTAMLNEGDPDDDGNELTYTVTSVTSNGTLRNNGTALGLNDTFTQADIDAGLITYDHDGTETTSDSFDFSLADGGEDGATPVAGTFNIAVTLVNESPTVATNTGATVDEGSSGNTVTTAMLNEGDPDDDGNELTYTVTSVTSNGTLRNNGTALGLNDTFTQADIDAGLITYDHDGSETTSDSFDFSLADGGEDGATPATGTFNFTVDPVNESPTIATNTGISVNEGDTGSTITTAMLNEGDPDDDGNELTYTVTSVTSNGTLRNNGTPLGLNDTFTQADVDAGLITYDHNGTETTSDSFDFSLADGGEDGASPVAGTFNIAVTLINEPPTIATNTGATVEEGSSGNTVTTAMLNEGDPDDDGAELTYTVTSVTSNGTLRNNGTALGLNDTFTQADIDAGLITYDHDGSETTSDSFDFSLADGGEDGATPVTGTFNFTVDPINESPTIATNTGITVNEGDTGSTITTAMLNEGDPDDDGNELTYTVTAVTSNGTLRNNGTALGLNDTFTQADIDAGLITYDHDDSETTSDSFDFSLADGGEDGATPVAGTFNITVTPVNDHSITPISDLDTNAELVLENSAPTTTVGITAFADDSDAADSVTYSLDDSDGGRFFIDPNSGVVTLVGSIDREFDGPVRSIIVRATSSDTSSITATFSISVGDVDEFDVLSVSDNDPATNAVAENSASGTIVGVTALATDNDATDSVSYSLDDSAGGRFQIDSVSGVVTVNGPLDFETSASHDVTVRASSTDGSSATGTFTIAINDVNEAPTASPDALNATPGSSLVLSDPGVIVNDGDVDGDTLNTILVVGPTNGTLTLQPGGGLVYTPNTDFFGIDSFTYRVTDGVLQSNAVTVQINVLGAPGTGSGSGSTPDPDPEPETEPDSTTESEEDSSSKESEAEEDNSESKADESTAEAVAVVASEASADAVVAPAPGQRVEEAMAGGKRGEASETAAAMRFEAFFGSPESMQITLQQFSADEAMRERLLQLDLEQAIVWQMWDRTDDQLQDSPLTIAVGAAGAATGLFSIGYVMWALRGGAIASVFASALPAWRFIDPVSLLGAYRASASQKDHLEAWLDG